MTSQALSLVERGEEAMRSLGFRIFRVRYLPPSGARVQVAPDEMSSVADVGARLFEGLREAGLILSKSIQRAIALLSSDAGRGVRSRRE